MKVAVYLWSLFLVLALSVQGYAQPDDKLIVPGQRIGNRTLNMTIDDLVRIYGPSNATGALNQHTPVTPGPAVNPDFLNNVYIYAWHRQQFFVGTLGEKSRRVVFVATFSGAYKTAKGLSLATPPERIEAL